MAEKKELEVAATGTYSDSKGGKIIITGLSSKQYQLIMGLVESWA